MTHLTTSAINFLKLMSADNALSGSHLRVLTTLREMDASALVISRVTGLSKKRVEARINDLCDRGVVLRKRVHEDGTNVWGLAPEYGVAERPSFPLEGHRQQRNWKEATGTANVLKQLRQSKSRKSVTEQLSDDLLDFVGEE